MRPSRLALPLLALVAAPTLLRAQATIAGDVTFASQYIARGITTTNRGVFQPSARVIVPAGRTTLTVNAWANYDGMRYDDPTRHISENGGAGTELAELDVNVEAARTVGRATLTVGALTYRFPNDHGTTSASNTTELYARVALDVPLAPSVQVWQDVRTVRGAYAEVAFARSVGPIAISATTGLNLGQSYGDGGASGYYARHGVTHVDLALAATRQIGGLTVTPSLHPVRGFDATTQVSAPGQARGLKLWIGTVVGWSRVAAFAGRPRVVAQAEPADDTAR